MDLTVVTDSDSADLLSAKHLKSVHRTIEGIEASCDLFYKPKQKYVNRVYAVLIGMQQEHTYGKFTGKCLVNEETILVDSYGFFEYVHWRWHE